MSSSTPKASVLLVGAYERDNFGDLLFYQLTKGYLGTRNSVAGSVIGADMTSLLGTRVYPYTDLLSARTWDAVWVVGGEVGGVDVEGALTMSLDDVEGTIFDQAGAAGRDAIARYLSGAPARSPAYLPILAKFALNATTPLVLNSVGLGNLHSEAVTSSADAARSAIRSAVAVIARYETSHQMATTIGAASVLSPDMVHSISVRHPDLAAPTRGYEPYFLFQANAQLIARVGEERIARSLAAIAAAMKWRPAFFVAGTARHHDRADLYDGITATLRVIAPTVRPMSIMTRNPMELASYIAGSRLWVGSSLHGRIIASSYALPRVSLENPKVANYAGTWDPDFPTNVAFDRLHESVAEAVTAAGSTNSADASRHIARIADESTAALVRDFL